MKCHDMTTYNNIYNKVYRLPLLLLLMLMLTGCYQTKNIPEDEYLYAGIKDFSYGHRWGERRKKGKDSTGVITAVADAYTAVEDVLRGNTTIVEELKQQELTQEEKDSLHRQEIIDNEAYSTARAEVAGALAYAPNGTIMGSSRWTHPFTVGLWVWNRYGQSESAFGKWMMNTLGATPKYISTVSPGIRTQVARNTLRNHGYFRGDVQYRIEDVKNPRKKKISYQILPGELFHLDRIEYRDFPLSIDTLIRQSMDASLLKRNDPFNVPTLSNERDRIASLLRNRGHYFFRSDHIAYRADTLMRPEHVQLQVLPSPTMTQAAKQPFHIGKTRITY